MESEEEDMVRLESLGAPVVVRWEPLTTVWFATVCYISDGRKSKCQMRQRDLF